MVTLASVINEKAVMAAISLVPDPEIPAVPLVELGIIRGLQRDPPALLITLTYSGCPATLAIEQMLRAALDLAGFADLAIKTVLAPPWTTDWITPRGRELLADYGIAPPTIGRSVSCPRCASTETVEVSQFGSTPCKAQWRCTACLEPRSVQMSLTGEHFHTLKVVDVRAETAEAIVVTLAHDEADAAAFAFRAGQHLTFRAMIDGDDVRRNYSLCSVPGDKLLRVGIKRVAGGRFSTWALANLAPGSTIETLVPHGSFAWDFDPAANRNYCAFAGGSGITPILSLISTALSVEPNSQFILLYGNRTSSSTMFLEELAALKDRYLPRLQVYHFLTAEADDIALFNGRLDEARVSHLFETLLDPAQIDASFICGPGPMIDAVKSALLAAGVDSGKFQIERFNVGALTAEQIAQFRAVSRNAEGIEMDVILDGCRRRIPFNPSAGSIFENARLAGMPAPYACKAGVCATCRAKLVAGDVKMLVNYGLNSAEIAAGFILTCQAIPQGNEVIVDYDG